nr:immunoglobulin light chain junction region [Macaca mulatta]MPN79747.1 immunoglobulin light chain junction region [Macaca mulatta]MPN79751.1 immunoglobulin light chain junction region [Macaca mulatta]MPN79754.1 immunoglobulin light chain junction region [Macaca mulatta]MPN79809.1 immunoglobulin light chain junction region [Macaca mulatta]
CCSYAGGYTFIF